MVPVNPAYAVQKWGRRWRMGRWFHWSSWGHRCLVLVLTGPLQIVVSWANLSMFHAVICIY